MDKAKANAIAILDRIEGTLIADLKSLKIVAEWRQDDADLKENLPGGLNYTLFLAGLIASETLGYFTSKNSDAGRSDENIKSFILNNSFRGHAFKKDKYLEILVSLRTNLVHVFGMTDLEIENITSELMLCVGGTKKPEVESEGKVVKLNGVKFVELVIDGFTSIKNQVLNGNGNSDIIKIISSKSHPGEEQVN